MKDVNGPRTQKVEDPCSKLMSLLAFMNISAFSLTVCKFSRNILEKMATKHHVHSALNPSFVAESEWETCRWVR